MLQALAVARGLPNGLTFADPPLFKYVLLVEYTLAYGLQRLAGQTASPQAFVDQFRADPRLLYLMARVTSAAFGASTTLAAAALGRAAASQRVGLIAAGLTATTYLLVRDAHFGVNDALVTLLVTLGLLPCVRVAHGGGSRDYLAAGALAGLAFAAKYDGIVLLAPLVVAHLSRTRGRAYRHLVLAGGACVAAAMVAFPSLVLEPGRVLQDVYVHLYLGAVGGYDGLDPDGGYAFYIRTLLTGMGWPLVVAAAAGLAIGLRARDRVLLVLASAPVTLLAVLGAQHMYFARFALPAVPALLVLAAVAFDRLMSRRMVVGAAVAVLAGLPGLLDAVRFDVLLTREDTRSLASTWITANLPADATVAIDAPPLGPTLIGGAQQALVANGWSLFDLSPAEYRARGVSYLVASSFITEARLVDAARDARRQAFSVELQGDAQLIAEFRPDDGSGEPPFTYDQIYAPFNALADLQRPGPTLRVYWLGSNAQADRSP